MSLSYFARATVLRLHRASSAHGWGSTSRKYLHSNLERPSASSIGIGNMYTPTRSSQDWERVLGMLEMGRVVGSQQSRNAATYRDQIFVTYHDLEEALRSKGYSLYRLGLFTMMSVVAVANLSWNRIKSWSAQEGAQVASWTLGDERLQMKAEDLAKSVANALLTDAETSGTAKSFLSEVAISETSREQAATFALDVCNSLVNDQKLVDEASSFMGTVLKSNEVWSSGAELGMYIVNDPQFRQEGLKTIREVLHSSEFKQAGYEFVSDCFSKTFREKEIKNEAHKVAHEVMQEENLRQTAGDSLWTAAKIGILGMKRNQREKEPVKHSWYAQEAST